ncbi:MAG: aldo/keto reductase, partial [Cellulomonas sp.]|nr:aldo/keto reductase [Cellulomonas sp.]
MPQYTLNDGTTLPAIGFGTYPLRGQAGVAAMADAIAAGYRLLDSAFNYDNEGAVGAAVRASGVPRDEIQVTSKLPGRYHRHDAAVRAVEESVLRTGLDHIDLYLIHWPLPRRDRYVEAWQALVECRERGLVRSIGVSNFLPEHLDRIERETGVVPAVNQVELHPWLTQDELQAYHDAHGIRTEAWAPVGEDSGLRDEPVISQIAAAHGVTPTQVILRWDVERGIVPLPKSFSPVHRRENIDVF